MKRLYLTVVALLSMTMTFAGDKNGMDAAGANPAATSATMAKADSTASYDISYNLRRLGETLGLTIDQMNSVEALNRIFRGDLKTAAEADKANRKALMDSAIEKDMKYMSYVLTPEQFDKYQTLINTTLANRGLEK